MCGLVNVNIECDKFVGGPFRGEPYQARARFAASGVRHSKSAPEGQSGGFCSGSVSFFRRPQGRLTLRIQANHAAKDELGELLEGLGHHDHKIAA